MTIELTDPINGDGLFDILGKGFHALNTLNIARETTVPTEVEDFLEQAENLVGSDLNYQAATAPVPAATISWQATGNSLSSTITTACADLLMEFVQDDSDQPDKNLKDSLKFLIDQMADDLTYVNPNVITTTLTTDTDNIGDAIVCHTRRRGDGRIQEHTLDETVYIEVTSDTSAVSPTLRFDGEQAEKNKLDNKWPMGSGIGKTLAATNPANSLLTNGDFEDTTISNVPDDWIIVIGTPASTVKITDPEIQTVSILGDPTGGHYNLYWENEDGVLRGTNAIAYNAPGATVQTELRRIAGLSRVTVVSSGTSPNFIHVVTFEGQGRDLVQLTSTNHLTGGGVPQVIHATTRAGDDGAYKGRSLRLDSDGTELTALYHAISLQDETVYFCHLRITRRTDEETSTSSLSESSSSASSSSSTSSSASSSSESSTSSSQVSTASSASTSSSSEVSTASTSSSSTSTSSSSLISTASSSSSTETSSTSSESSSSEGLTSSSSTSTSSGGSSESSSVASSESSSTSSSSPSSPSSSSVQAEEIRIEIVDEINGVLTQDEEGYDNGIRINAANISTNAFDSEWFSFRLQRNLTQPVYLRIRITGPITLGDSVYIDEVAIVAGTQLYTGGPWVAAFSGATPAVTEDKWELTVTNDRAGEFQEWFNRAFDMAAKEYMLPSSGNTLIPDTLIA